MCVKIVCKIGSVGGFFFYIARIWQDSSWWILSDKALRWLHDCALSHSGESLLSVAMWFDREHGEPLAPKIQAGKEHEDHERHDEGFLREEHGRLQDGLWCRGLQATKVRGDLERDEENDERDEGSHVGQDEEKDDQGRLEERFLRERR